MRRTISLLSTLFLLVCAQSAGLLHGIAHAAPRHDAVPVLGVAAVQATPAALIAQGRDAPAESAGGSCEKCFQFAHFSGGVAPQALAFPFADTVDARAGVPQAALVARAAPALRSRGPPAYL
jgi:hypothetical protein